MRTAVVLALLIDVLSMIAARPALAQSVRDIASRGACSTAGVEGISRQLIQTQRCMGGGGFVRFDDHRNIRLTSSRVHPFVQRSARDALHRAADRVRLDVTSAFRPIAEQYVLYHSGGCAAAASPGASNHQSGRAVDVANWSGARSALGGAGCAWLGSFDAVHFDCPGGDRRSDAVRAFQRLWNMNHPGDRIAEDGIYGPGTANRLGRSPAHGFAQSGCCVARCDGDVVVRADCTRHRCGEHATCAMDGGPRCVDSECPTDGSRATLCASSGELLVCEERRGARLACGDGDVCAGGACVVEGCANFEGATCLDARTLGQCSGGTLRAATPCADGCVEAAGGARCQEEGACAGADGAVCLDARTLGQCSGGVLLGTETCEAGCASGAAVGAVCARAVGGDAGVSELVASDAEIALADGGATPVPGAPTGCSAGGGGGGPSWWLVVLAFVALGRRRSMRTALLVMLALAASAPSGAQAQVPEACRTRTRFAESEPGDRAGWTERNPERWCVMDRGEEFRYALHATGYSSREGTRLGEQSVFGDALGDVELTVRARTLEDSAQNTSADYGLILGWQSASDYYLALVHPVAENCGIFVVKDGMRQKLAACSSPLGLDALLHDVSFRRRTVEGGAQWLEMTFDGRLVAYTLHDEGPLGPGKVGLGSMNDAALFDDPTVAPYPAAPPTPDAAIEEDAGIAPGPADAGVENDDASVAPSLAPDGGQPGTTVITGGCRIGASPGSRATIAPALLVIAMLWRTRRRALVGRR